MNVEDLRFQLRVFDRGNELDADKFAPHPATGNENGNGGRHINVESFSDVGSRIGEENEALRNLLSDTGRKIGELDELKEAFDKIVAPFNSTLRALELEKSQSIGLAANRIWPAAVEHGRRIRLPEQRVPELGKQFEAHHLAVANDADLGHPSIHHSDGHRDNAVERETNARKLVIRPMQNMARRKFHFLPALLQFLPDGGRESR